MPLTTPLPRSPAGLLLLRPPAQNQTVPNKSAIVASPHPRRCPATWSGARSPLHLPRGRPGGGEVGPRGRDFRSPWPPVSPPPVSPALTPGPVAGDVAWGVGGFSLA